jgi:hypothetical protein
MLEFTIQPSSVNILQSSHLAMQSPLSTGSPSLGMHKKSTAPLAPISVLPGLQVHSSKALSVKKQKMLAKRHDPFFQKSKVFIEIHNYIIIATDQK